MIMFLQVCQSDVFAISDPTKVSESGMSGNALKNLGHGFNLLMIGSDPIPDQPIRRRQAVVHIYLRQRVRLLEQIFRRVKGRGSRTQNANAERACFSSEFSHETALCVLSKGRVPTAIFFVFALRVWVSF